MRFDHLAADPVHCRFHAEAGLYADEHQVQTIREAMGHGLAPPVRLGGDDQVREIQSQQRTERCAEIEGERRKLRVEQPHISKEQKRDCEDQDEAQQGEDFRRRGRLVSRRPQLVAQHIALGIGETQSRTLDAFCQLGPCIGALVLKRLAAADPASCNLANVLPRFDPASGQAAYRDDADDDHREDESEYREACQLVGDEKIEHVRPSD